MVSLGQKSGYGRLSSHIQRRTVDRILYIVRAVHRQIDRVDPVDSQVELFTDTKSILVRTQFILVGLLHRQSFSWLE